MPRDEPDWIVPLSTWKTSRATLRRHHHPVAVLLEPDADLRELADADGTLDPSGIAFIAVDFPIYTDGRGYSLAQLLRTRYQWQGELRAVGDVMIDTIPLSGAGGLRQLPGQARPRSAQGAGRVQYLHGALPEDVSGADCGISHRILRRA